MLENIRLVATDLDGTLLDSGKNVPREFEDYVIRHKELKFVIASGRQYYNILELFPKASDRLIFIAENGGLVFEGGKVLHEDPMSWDDVRNCIREFSDPSVCCLILCGIKSAYMLKSSSKEAVLNSYKYYKRLEYVDSFNGIDDDIIKIAVFVEGYIADEFYRKITPIDQRLDYLLSGDCWIDIANRSVSKGSAIKMILKSLGLSRDSAMAFGDYLNDMSLLEECGVSYAMANSHPDLKAKALYLAPGNDENGVMKILKERFGE